MNTPLYTDHGLTAEGFKFYTAKARRMTPEALYFSIDDCRACVRLEIDPLRYIDEISCYTQELFRRSEGFRKVRTFQKAPQYLPLGQK